VKTKNADHSVRERLLNLSRKSGEDFQLLLTRYAVERLLFRLARSEYRDSFVLKGAMLFALWTGEMHRPTRDVDFLGFGDASQEHLGEVFRSLCTVSVDDDGLTFNGETVTVEAIREDQEYGGQRVKFTANLGQARVVVQVDVGFGDAVTPAPEEVEYPTLLGMDPPKLRAYPKETVVAEKLDALVKLGVANSRMKDFYDLVVIARTFAFEGDQLRAAITATFERRGTPLPKEPPRALTDAFAKDNSKAKQWKAFCQRSGLEERVGDLPSVVAELGAFLIAPLAAGAAIRSFAASWPPGGPWTARRARGS
jgi:predicted nucleotidyltransferase component of viral defense system